MSKKVAINTCFGGFRLSLKGALLYYELKGLEVFVYERTKSKYKDGVDEYRKITDLDRIFDSHNFIEVEISQKDLGEIAYNVPFIDFLHIDYDNKEFREDRALIETIETLGNEANSSVSDIDIVTIPQWSRYSIDKFDGQEKISFI